MLDMKFVRENPDIVKENIKKKFQDYKLPLVNEVLMEDKELRQTQQHADDLRANRKKISKEIGKLMGQGKKEEAEEIKQQMAEIAHELTALEEKEINDILQATYTYAFMNMDKLSDDKNFLKWITVLLNKQLREYMQAKEHADVTTALRGLPQYRQSDVDDCLNEMPENQKTVTIMHCLGKLKEKDIANRLKMSEEGVARLLKSGKQKVKDVLDKK